MLPRCLRGPDRERACVPGWLAVGDAGCPRVRKMVPAGVAMESAWLPLPLSLGWLQ